MQNYTVGDQDLTRKEFFGALIPLYLYLTLWDGFKLPIHCSGCVFTVCVCVCVFTAVRVHLDGLNAEHEFRVWVTILGCMSRHFTFTFTFTIP